MASKRSQVLATILKLTLKKMFCKSANAAKERGLSEKISAMMSRRKAGTKALVGGVSGEWQEAKAGSKDTIILYLHGGGYVIGSPITHRGLVGSIADAAQARVFILDYRLSPETPFPGALDDAVAAYKALLEAGEKPEKIIIAGDSAGGGLTIATLISLKAQGIELPAAGVCLSPWVDLTFSGDSMMTKAKVDPILSRDSLAWFAEQYLAGQDASNPLVSPIFADLSGLSPLLIQVGSDEVLLDDAIRLNKAAIKAGVDSTLEVWDGQMHVWPLVSTFVPEGKHAIEVIATFIKART